MIAHIALSLTFAQKEFFSDGPKGFECILDLSACRSTPFLASGYAPKRGFSLRIAHIAHSLYFSPKSTFFGWSQRVWMHFWPLCMHLWPPISCFLPFGTNSSPEKMQHFLVSPNFIRIVPNWLFFGAATGSEVHLCTKIRTFLRDPPHPSQNWNFHLIDKIADFLHNKLFFLIPRGICIIIGPLRNLAQPCAFKNTFFSLWECPKMGFSP